MTVLTVEDDRIILEGLKYSLLQEGYEVLAAANAAEAAHILDTGRWIDFCLIDVMLPDGDGFSVCQKIRENSQVPILFLTACSDEGSTVRALELGADDYIAKPFRIRELLARMKAILRRTEQAGSEAGTQADSAMVTIGTNQVDLHAGRVYRDGEEVLLTAMEYRLLLVFISHRGQVLARSQILDQIWDGAGEYVNDNTLTVYIKRLRKKLNATQESPMIRTIRGIGYLMDK